MKNDSDVPAAAHAWRSWNITGRVATFLYVTGITSSGGSASMVDGEWSYTLPRFNLHPRCYMLGLPRWWWECHKRQGWKVWTHHRPERPFALGVCAACVPCPSCGAHYTCEPDCIAWAD